MSELYTLFNKEKLDPNKKTVFAFLLDVSLKKQVYAVTYRYIFNTLKILHKDFNIVILARNLGDRWMHDYIDHPEYGNYAYLAFDKTKAYTKGKAADMTLEEKVVYFESSFNELRDNESYLFDKYAGCVSSQIVIPALDTNFEIISDDEKLLFKQKRAAEKFTIGLQNHKLISHNAFIYKPIGMPLEFIIWLMKNYKDKFYYGFCHDTAAGWPLFDKNINPFTKNLVNYYFIDDNRGIRNFTKYPLTELQDFYDKPIYDKKYYESVIENKKLDFVFGGLFPFDVNYRQDAWYNFFQNLNVNGIIRTQVNGKSSISNKTFKIEQKSIKDITRKCEQLVGDILTHPMVQHTVPYDEYNDNLKDSMFTIILKCYYGKYDSLNFRVINSLYYGTIPLIDEQYDIDDLQIPTNLKQKLVVNNNEDIKEKIEFYKLNPDKYKELFFELYDYFINSKYFDVDYFNGKFQSEYFPNLYK